MHIQEIMNYFKNYYKYTCLSVITTLKTIDLGNSKMTQSVKCFPGKDHYLKSVPNTQLKFQVLVRNSES